MPVNLEFKAYCDSPERVEAALERLGATPVRRAEQTDAYYSVPSGKLKLRRTAGAASELIFYQRLNSPTIRESESRTIALDRSRSGLGALLDAALGRYVEVSKLRATYRLQDSLIHIDWVSDLGRFLEVEVRVGEETGAAAAERLAAELQRQLEVHPASILPWSYSDLKVLTEAAKAWRAKLPAGGPPPRVILLDGASATGKSTLLEAASAAADVIQRLTTREPRDTTGEIDSEIRYVPPSEFRRLLEAQELVEFRDFLFGMSYALPWAPIVTAVNASRASVGLINLGNGPHIKRYFPEATTVLVDAPLEQIESRLRARSVHTEEQLEERLENARRAKAYRPHYDVVVDNEDGLLDASVERLLALLAPRPTSSPAPSGRG